MTGRRGDAATFSVSPCPRVSRVPVSPSRVSLSPCPRVSVSLVSPCLRVEQFRPRPTLVDGEIVDHRLHGERQRSFQFTLGTDHQLLHVVLGGGLGGRIKDESHAAAGHAAQHPKPPEPLAEFSPRTADQLLGKEITDPRNDRLDRAVEIALGHIADAAHIAIAQRSYNLVEDATCLLPAQPLSLGAQQVLFGDHLQDRADVLCHAAMHQHQAVLQTLARLGRNLIDAIDAMARQQAPATDAVLGVVGTGQHARDQLDARPDAARILPAAARAGQPLAQDRPRGHQTPFVLRQLAGQALACPVARIQTATRQASRFVETASREPFGMRLTLLTSSMPRPGPTSRASRSARLCSEPSMPGGTSPAAISAAFSSPR